MCINALCVDDFQSLNQDQHLLLQRTTPQPVVAQDLPDIMPHETQPVQDEQPPKHKYVHNHCHHLFPFDGKKDDPVVKAVPSPAAADAPTDPRHHCRGCLNKCQTCENAYCMT
jgi:hypothetical protein